MHTEITPARLSVEKYTHAKQAWVKINTITKTFKNY